MKRDDNLTRIALLGDLTNTLGGGNSEPAIQTHKLHDSHVIEVKVPGVKEESLKVEIHNNWLTIFQALRISSRDVEVQLPRIVFNKAIPYFIDVEKIEAKFEDEQLIVRLPFNERANGYHRKIGIRQ
jgi:HSP20 family molecular chaperone IbpA